ncbi:kinase domain-containing protein, partial [Blastomyces dermatitidis ATCC 18188]
MLAVTAVAAIGCGDLPRSRDQPLFKLFVDSSINTTFNYPTDKRGDHASFVSLQGSYEMIPINSCLLHFTWRRHFPSIVTLLLKLAPKYKAPKYKYIEDCERLERYCPGGFYPLKLGDRLCDGCYSIVQNLGFGGSSTVWLAADQKQQDEIWTLGCTIFEIIGSGGGILQDQVSVLGKLPDPWWSQWESKADFFNEDATIDIMTGAPFQDSG